MRGIILPVAAIAILISSSRAVPQDGRDRPDAGPPTASLSGRVVSAETGQPIRWARVTLRSGSRSLATTTDENGHYRFDGLSAGRYFPAASKPGFVALPFGARSYGRRPASLVLSPAERARADFALPRGAAIEGRVTTADGEAARAVSVQALRLVNGTPLPQTIQVGLAALTDDRGMFRLHSLPAGSYLVKMAPAAGRRFEGAPEVPAARPFADTYYPGTARFNDAQRVSIAAGASRQIECVLAEVPLATIGVRILDSRGREPGSAAAILQLARGPVARSGTLPAGSSRVRFLNIAPGDYRIVASAQTQGSEPEFAAVDLRIDGTSVSEMVVTTAPGATVRGRIEANPDAAPSLDLTGIAVSAVNTALPAIAGDPNGPSQPARADAAGLFEFRNLFGSRVLRTPALAPPWALTAVLVDGQDVTDLEVDFSRGAGARQLRVVLTDQTGGISGSVTGATGRPVEDVRIVVFADDESRWRAPSRFVAVGAVSPRGEFSVDALLPGAYFVRAVIDLPENAWRDPDVLRELRAAAARVVVEARATQSVTLLLEGR
jgi:hypothetical protein